MILNYFQVIRIYNQEDYHRKHPADTQHPGDVSWRFPKDNNVRDAVVGRSWDQMMGRSKDVRGTSVKHVF